ncbi:hypothetical protein G5V59_09480 [Nocardioides sp. W3-2-3]|uniref:hypothetical protein n=1 Tax=Nocardioides convexus TaxID=2712224 RepID=UPI0024187BE8|nr:hypothetical protein [Nocardioides convexus]NHA00262.1 hypothetical protein [Nocardioides convexus]
MLLLNTPAAIALYYVVSLILPMIVWGVLYSLFEWARDLIPWIDPGYALQPLISDIDPMGDATVVDAMTFVRVLFTIVLWVVIPVTLGALRLKRAEVK